MKPTPIKSVSKAAMHQTLQTQISQQLIKISPKREEDTEADISIAQEHSVTLERDLSISDSVIVSKKVPQMNTINKMPQGIKPKVQQSPSKLHGKPLQ
jgi:hypothetical protein